MEVSKRLQRIAGFVTWNHTVADIGTDHGYLPVYLIKEGISKKVLAMDIGKGPLKSAEKTIASYGLADCIETRLSDGLAGLQQGETDTIVIAGMGGELVCGILGREIEKAKAAKELILSPQSEIFKVRAFLREHGFTIVKEDMLVDEGKFYVIMKAIPEEVTEAADEDWYFVTDRYGKLLLQAKHPILREFLEKEKKGFQNILSGLQTADSERARAREAEITKELDTIDTALTYWEEET